MFTLSFKVRESRRSIVHPKWWQFWKRAKLKATSFTVVKTIRLPFSDKQCKEFINNPSFTHLLTNLYGGVSEIELTKGVRKPVYYDIEGNIVEDVDTNTLTHLKD